MELLTSDIFPELDDITTRIEAISKTGFSLILHFHPWRAPFGCITFDEEWVSVYHKYHLVFIDPVVIWSLSNTGAIRWSDIPPSFFAASDYVFERSAKFGLKYGAVVSRRPNAQGGRKCLLSVARDDRELTSDELTVLEGILDDIMKALEGRFGLTPAELRTLSLVSEGKTADEIAALEHISVPAIKKRFTKIRKTLKASNLPHAVAIALRNGLIVT